MANNNNNSTGWKLVKIPYILGGLLLLILGIFSMTSGTKKILDSNTDKANVNKDDSRISYDENTDTYTYTIWEDEEFKNNPNVINVTVEP